MPQKDITSSNENTFSMGRSMFSRTINTLKNEDSDALKQKQFYGGTRNRDASSVVRSRSILGAKGSFADENGVAFQGYNNNDTRQALTRVRAGGATVPRKVTHKHLM